MRNLILTGLALLAVVPAFAQVPNAPEAKQTPVPAAAAKLVSIDVKDARFSDAILALAKQGHFSFVADAYLVDFPVKRVQIEAIPLDVAIQRVAELFERKISKVNGVYILSHSRRVLVIKQDEFQKTQYASTWTIAGQLSINPITKIRAGTTTLEIKPEMMLPSFVSVEANAIAFYRFAEQMAAVTDSVILLNKDLAERRLSAYFERTTPGEAAEAIATLFHARQRITIEQSDAQIKQDAAALAEIADQRTPSHKASDVLLPKIVALLSAEQIRAYNQGKDVAIPLVSLPADLQKMAMDYVALCIAELEKTPDFPHPDPAKGFSLNLRITNATISVDAFAADGTRLGF